MVLTENPKVENKFKVESPLSVFNNVINDITEKIEKIYIGNTKSMSFRGKLLFEINSITIANKVKLISDGDNVSFKFCGSFEGKDMSLVKTTYENQDKLFGLFHQYLFVAGNISRNFDGSISANYVNSIIGDCLSTPICCSTKKFLIPYKVKIQHLYDSCDGTVEKLYNRFSYVLCVYREDVSKFSCSIQRVLSSELSENKSLDNLRFEEIATIKKCKIAKKDLTRFMSELFFYGNVLTN